MGQRTMDMEFSMDINESDVHAEWIVLTRFANIDEDGYMQITDRVKDGNKSGGEWIVLLK